MIFSDQSDYDFKADVRFKSFVYFLKQGDEVVYVGQTRTGISRPMSHYDKVFDSVSLIECPVEDLNVTESQFIFKYTPIYNRTIPKSFSLASLKTAIRNHGFSKCTITDIKKYIRKNSIETKSLNALSYVSFDDAMVMIREMTRGVK